MLISAANSKQFEKLKHLVSSIQFWNPNYFMTIYNVGNDWKKEQLSEAKSWCHISVVEKMKTKNSHET